jgi:hypothetical protein
MSTKKPVDLSEENDEIRGMEEYGLNFTAAARESRCAPVKPAPMKRFCPGSQSPIRPGLLTALGAFLINSGWKSVSAMANIWPGKAQQNPGIPMIGCEPFVNGVAALCVQVRDHNLQNIRLWPDDARLLMKHLPDQSVDRLFLLNSDPWPKTRHHKRRFIQQKHWMNCTAF